PSRTSLHRAPQSSASRRLSILRAHVREPRPSEPSTVVLPSSPAPSKAPTPDVARCSALHLISHSCVSKQRPARRRTINSRPQPLCAGSGFTGQTLLRPRRAGDAIVWTEEAYERLQLVPLSARPLARNTVERFAREHGFWRITTRVMDENKQAMIGADEFDMDTMLVMFKELQAKQLR